MAKGKAPVATATVGTAAAAVTTSHRVVSDPSLAKAESAPVKASELLLGPYTALSAIVRNGVEHAPGDTLTFSVHEAAHVRELLSLGVLHPGADKAARLAVEAAERERASARSTPLA